MTPQEIISDDEIARVHGNANFGAMDPREVVNDGVRKTAVGYHCGSTQLHILRDHGLVTKPRPGSSDADLTKKGKAYARSIYRDTTPARAEAQDEGAATDALVDRFAVALKAKLRAAGEKYGFDDAWRADDWRDKLIEDLWRHVQKGDPRDVAAYCAFAWHHQWSLSNGVFPRAGKNLITPQDEGAAGEPVAKVVRKGFSTGSISWTKFGQDADLSDETPLYAHPSPTPAADADRVLDETAKYLKAQYGASYGLDHPRDRARIKNALKSTAAKEGGE